MNRILSAIVCASLGLAAPALVFAEDAPEAAKPKKETKKPKKADAAAKDAPKAETPKKEEAAKPAPSGW